MKLLRKLLAGSGDEERRIDAQMDAMLDAFLVGLWKPFPDEWSHCRREGGLAGYVQRQMDLARELATTLNLSTPLSTDALDIIWQHFLRVHRVVRSSRPQSRIKGSPRSDWDLSHRYDLDTLKLLEKTGASLGVALQSALPTLRWVVGHIEGENYAYEGVPILRGFPGDFPEMNPTGVVITSAHRSLAYLRPDELSRLFGFWVQGTVIAGLEDEEEH